MEFFLISIALAIAVYLFFKSNTARGAETVRAHVFLGGIQSGATIAEANHVVGFDIINGPPEVIQSAIAHLKSEYGGKQLPMIMDAYRHGMKSDLPLWYRTIARLRPNSIQVP